MMILSLLQLIECVLVHSFKISFSNMINISTYVNSGVLE